MTKQEKLTLLDNLVLDKMLEFIESNETHRLAELSTASVYLKNNEVVETKKQSDDVVEARKKKLEEVKAKREKQV